MQIYVLINNEQTGPYSLNQIKEMLRIGALTTDHLAWFESLHEWEPISSIQTILDFDALPKENDYAHDENSNLIEDKKLHKNKKELLKKYIYLAANKPAKFGPFSSLRHQWASYCVILFFAFLLSPLLFAGKILTFIHAGAISRATAFDAFSIALNEYLVYSKVIQTWPNDFELFLFSSVFIWIAIIPASFIYMLIFQIFLWPISFFIKNLTCNFYVIAGLAFFIIMIFYYHSKYLNL